MTNRTEHLGPGQLAGFLDHDLSPAQRLLVEAHLDQCPECRHELAEVVRLAASVSAPNRMAHQRSRRWVPLVLTGALAASLAGVVVVRRSGAPEDAPVTQPVRAPTVSESRAQIGIVSPAENATTPPRRIHFTWRALAADLYRVTLVTESGEPVWTLETLDTATTLPASVSLLPGQAYFWRVDAISAGIIASSRSHRFRVSP